MTSVLCPRLVQSRNLHQFDRYAVGDKAQRLRAFPVGFLLRPVWSPGDPLEIAHRQQKWRAGRGLVAFILGRV